MIDQDQDLNGGQECPPSVILPFLYESLFLVSRCWFLDAERERIYHRGLREHIRLRRLADYGVTWREKGAPRARIRN